MQVKIRTIYSMINHIHHPLEGHIKITGKLSKIYSKQKQKKTMYKGLSQELVFQKKEILDKHAKKFVSKQQIHQLNCKLGQGHNATCGPQTGHLKEAKLPLLSSQGVEANIKDKVFHSK